MFTAFAFWMAVRSRELPSGLGPPSLTEMAISFPKRVNCTAIFAQRLNFRSFLNSNALPMGIHFFKVCYHICRYTAEVKPGFPIPVVLCLCIVDAIGPRICDSLPGILVDISHGEIRQVPADLISQHGRRKAGASNVVTRPDTNPVGSRIHQGQCTPDGIVHIEHWQLRVRS